MSPVKCPFCGSQLPSTFIDTAKAGAKGGKAATGQAKRRSRAHYVAAGKASAAARAAKRKKPPTD